MTTDSFGVRLQALTGPERLCVGVDPHPSTLSEWGLDDSAEGLAVFSRTVLDAMLECDVTITKPQVALYERHGIAGLRTLAQFIADARAHSMLVIADVKRGDIGTSLAGYASAWLQPGSDFESDAMTAVAYQGVGSLEPAFQLAAEAGKGVFVLAATSNPEGWALQSARSAEGESVSQLTIKAVAERSLREPASLGSWLGVVVGATVDRDQLGVDSQDVGELSILAPGFGAQGVALSDMTSIFGDMAPQVIPSVSRSVSGSQASGVAERITQHLAEVSGGF